MSIEPYLGLVLFIERVLEVAARGIGALRETRGECALGFGQFLEKREDRRQMKEDRKRRNVHE